MLNKYKKLKSNFCEPKSYLEKDNEQKKFNLYIKFENKINKDILFKKQNLNIIIENITLFEDKKKFKVESYTITPCK